MRIHELIYFSPSLKMEEIDLKNKQQVLEYFPERVYEYYLKPTTLLVENKMAFAAGALECILIDALARYSYSENSVGTRISLWCQNNLGVSEQTAISFYQFFRCGLLHEGHIKQFGQFCFDDWIIAQPLIELQDFIVVNPKYLLDSINVFFNAFIAKLSSDDMLYALFIRRLIEDFEIDINKSK